jgi:hypothetical protein
MSDEAKSVRWENPDEIPRLMTPAFAVRVDDALSTTAAVTRVHDGVRIIST